MYSVYIENIYKIQKNNFPLKCYISYINLQCNKLQG